MKKIYLLFTLLSLCIINVYSLNASCEEEADYIDYELMYIDNEEEGLVARSIIYDIEDDLYIKVTNDFDNKTVTYTSSNKNDSGFIVFDSPSTFKKVKFLIDVYSNDETCNDRKLRTIRYVTKKYNEYSSNSLCDGLSDKLEICDSFYDSDNLTLEEFTNTINKYNEDNSFLGYVKRYYLYVLIPILLISIIYIIRITILRRRKKNA